MTPRQEFEFAIKAIILVTLCVGIFIGSQYLLADAYGQRPAIQNVVNAVRLEHSTSFVVFPQDCNANFPMLFGGKTLAEMDRCAGITARRFLYQSATAKDAVTIAINKVRFVKSAEVKDLLFVTGKVIKVGESSITINITVEKETKELGNMRELIAEGEFVFVSYDLVGKKAIPHGISLTSP